MTSDSPAPEEAIRAQVLEEAACVAERGLGGYLCPYGRDKPGDPTWNHTDADICPVCRENSEGSLLKCHDQIPARIAARIRALITDPAAIAAWNRRAGGEREYTREEMREACQNNYNAGRTGGGEREQQLEAIAETARAFVSFVDNNLPNMEPHEVSCVFGHLEWDELRAALAGQTEGERNGG